jgi:hypothetical protein
LVAHEPLEAQTTIEQGAVEIEEHSLEWSGHRSARDVLKNLCDVPRVGETTLGTGDPVTPRTSAGVPELLTR